MNDIIAAERLLLGKEPNIKAGEGYLYQYFNFETGAIQIEDESGTVILTRPVNMIRKGLQTDYGKIVVTTGGKVYFDTRQIASTATVNRYILQKSIFSKFKTPKPPKLDAPPPAATPETAQDSQTSAEPTNTTPKAPEAPQTAPEQPKAAEAPKAPEAPTQPKFVPGQERPGHKYIKRVPDPKNPGKYIYYYQEDIDAENQKELFLDEEGKQVKEPLYGRKYHEQRYKNAEGWKPQKRSFGDILAREPRAYEYDLGNGKKITAYHRNESSDHIYTDTKGGQGNFFDGEYIADEIEERLKNDWHAIKYGDEVVTGTTSDPDNNPTGLLVYNTKTKQYRHIEGDPTVADEMEPNQNEAAEFIKKTWQESRQRRQQWESQQQAPQPEQPKAAEQPEQPTPEETPQATLPENATEGQGEDFYQEGNEYTINGFTGTLTARQGRVGILKDREGNLKLFKLEHFEVQPYAAPENAPEEKKLPEFKTFKEYQEHRESERRAKNEQLVRRMKAGGVRYRKTQEEIEAEERAAAEKEKIRQESIARNRELMETDGYKTGRQEMENRGFTVGNNEFIATKEVAARNYKFALKAEFNPATGEWKHKLSDAPYTTVEVDGERHSIDDMNNEGVFYRAVETPEPSLEMDMFGGDEAQSSEPREVTKFISYDELEEKNGKRIFEKTADSKGLVSTRDAEDILFPDDEEEKGVWEVVELDDLIASNNLDGSDNPLYTNKEVQNRNRKKAGTQMQITEIANNMDFRRLSPNSSMSALEGSPIVDQDYEVVAGNGRVMGIAKHYKEMGKDKYRNELLKRADALGFDRSEIEQMKHPVAVRRMNVSKERAIQLGNLSNKDTKLAQSESEETRAYARLIKDEGAKAVADEINSAVEKLKQAHLKRPGGSSENFAPTTNEILDIAGYNIYKAFRKYGVVAGNDAPKFYDLDNKIVNSHQKQKMVNVLTHYLLGDQASEKWENAYDKTRQSVQATLGSLLQLKGTEHDLTNEIGEVIRLQGTFREINKKREEDGQSAQSPENYMLELKSDMFGGSEVSPEVEKMFVAMHYANQRKTRDMINKYAQAVQGDLFTDRKSKAEIINDVFGGRHSSDVEEEEEEPETTPGPTAAPESGKQTKKKDKSKEPATPAPETKQEPESSPAAPGNEEPEDTDTNLDPNEKKKSIKERFAGIQPKPGSREIAQQIHEKFAPFIMNELKDSETDKDFSDKLYQYVARGYSNYHRRPVHRLNAKGREKLKELGLELSNEDLDTVSIGDIMGRDFNSLYSNNLRIF